jgi:hypothetical protein
MFGLLLMQDDLVIDDTKYHVKVIRRGPTTFNVNVNNSYVDVVARKLGDGGFLLQVKCIIHRSSGPSSW